MSALVIGHSSPAITSAEIAALVNSRHDDTKRAIERLADRGVIVRPPMAVEPGSDVLGRRREVRVFLFSGERGRRDSIVLVAQLSPEFTARLVDRWAELEARVAAPNFEIPQSLPDALRLAAEALDARSAAEAKAHELEQQVAKQSAALSAAAPKALALDRLAATDGTFCLRDSAKILQLRPMDLRAWLVERAWIYARPGCSALLGYQSRVQAGWLTHRITTVQRGDGTDKTVSQVRITAKGLSRIAELLAAAHKESGDAAPRK